MSNGNGTASPGRYLTFVLANQAFGVPIEVVREINRLTDITPVPQAPAFVAGIINLRGRVIPVLDLRMKFGMTAAPFSKETCIVVIEHNDVQIGNIVDAVSGVVDFKADQIAAPPMMGDATKMRFIIGMGKEEGRLIVLVDVKEFLSPETFSETLQLHDSKASLDSNVLPIAG